MFLKKSILGLLCGAMAACTSVKHGSLYSPEHALKAGDTGVYVYTKNFSNFISGFEPELYLDGKLLAEMPNGAYYYTKLSPGSHVLAIKFKDGVVSSFTNSHSFALNAHQIKYFEGRWQPSDRHSTFMMGTVPVRMPDYEWKLYSVSAQEGHQSVIQLPVSR